MRLVNDNVSKLDAVMIVTYTQLWKQRPNGTAGHGREENGRNARCNVALVCLTRKRGHTFVVMAIA